MEETKVKSLAKALKVLECFNSKNPELGITQISKMLNMGKSSVSNIVSTYEQLGYLEQNPETGRYSLDLKLLEFSYIINERLGYQRLFHDVMQDVSKQLNVITYFAKYRNGEVFYLCNSYPQAKAYDYPYRSIIGETAAMYCTSLGKAMMAHLPADELERVLRQDRIAYTEYTITDEAVIREEISTVRRQGYALDREEHEYGLRCMGVPILTGSNTLYGALSMSSPNLDFSTDEAVQEYARIMKEAALALRERIVK
ncbi:IclR family transcriptional regulator [Oscillospiraceae bacterium MB08-C2-2]|nr:IclR family transcriptional regulator [Oscillospiraceae bacterium MB08-C2-2]